MEYETPEVLGSFDAADVLADVFGSMPSAWVFGGSTDPGPGPGCGSSMCL